MGLLLRVLTLAGFGAVAVAYLSRERGPLAGGPDHDSLESRLAALEPPDAPRLGAEAFRSALDDLLAEARRDGHPHLDVNAGALHRAVGGYPGPQHRMPDCCAAMRRALQPGDLVLKEPKSGQGASLTFRYRFATDQARARPHPSASKPMTKLSRKARAQGEESSLPAPNA